MTGGDGGSHYDAYLGRDTPSLILYTDGQLLIRGQRYRVQDWYVEKTLSSSEICALLGQIQSTGFFDVKGTGQDFPNDPIYQKKELLGAGGGGYIIMVNGKPSKWVFILWPALDNVIPEVKAAYHLLNDYQPHGIKPYVADRLLLQIEHGPVPNLRSTPPPPQPWPPDLPSLAELFSQQTDGLYVDAQAQSRQVQITGEVAKRLLKYVPNAPSSGIFVEGSDSYFVNVRPLLPHETTDYYSIYPWASSSPDLPFQCSH